MLKFFLILSLLKGCMLWHCSKSQEPASSQPSSVANLRRQYGTSTNTRLGFQMSIRRNNHNLAGYLPTLLHVASTTTFFTSQQTYYSSTLSMIYKEQGPFSTGLGLNFFRNSFSVPSISLQESSCLILDNCFLRESTWHLGLCSLMGKIHLVSFCICFPNKTNLNSCSL